MHRCGLRLAFFVLLASNCVRIANLSRGPHLPGPHSGALTALQPCPPAQLEQLESLVKGGMLPADSPQIAMIQMALQHQAMMAAQAAAAGARPAGAPAAIPAATAAAKPAAGGEAAGAAAAPAAAAPPAAQPVSAAAAAPAGKQPTSPAAVAAAQQAAVAAAALAAGAAGAKPPAGVAVPPGAAAAAQLQLNPYAALPGQAMLQQQQQLLARHLAQPTTLPLQRLTPQQSLQLMQQVGREHYLGVSLCCPSLLCVMHLL